MGGPLDPPLLTGLDHPYALATDGTTLYFANDGVGDTDGSIETCTITSCMSTRATLVGHQSHPQAIAIDAQGIYWLNRGSGTVMKLAR
jgi:hypothetical protein